MSFHLRLGDPDNDAYFASLSRSDMQQILTTHGIQWTPDMNRFDLALSIMEAGLGPPQPQTTDLDTPPEIFHLLESLVVDKIDALIKEISRSALTQRLIGQQEALDWVMQQIEDIRNANTAKDPKWAPQLPEPCNTCHGQGWVIEGQSLGFPSGEQVQCPDCIPPGPVSMTQQQPGESRAQWKNRTFAMQYGSGPVLFPPSVAKSLRESTRNNPTKITPTNSDQRAEREMDAKLLAYAHNEGGPQYMGWPARWFDSPHWRCIHNHVTRSPGLHGGDRLRALAGGGTRCTACGREVHITFPEDRDGPLPSPAEAHTPRPSLNRNQFNLLQEPWVQKITKRITDITES